MRRRHLMLGALSLVLAGCKQEAKVETPEVRPVRTARIQHVRLDDTKAAVGEIRPRRDIDLGFRVSGKVTERRLDVGDAFKAGDLIARVDAQDYVERLNSAKADVAGAEAVLVEAQAQEHRTAKLYDDGFATRPQMDAAVKGLNSARAKLQSARASLALAESQLAYTELRAEFDGIVTATGAEEGQVINTGQMVIRAAESGVSDAVFNVAEEAFGRHDGKVDGLAVRVSLLGRPEVAAVGRVREIAPVADAATRTYQVRVGLEHAPAEMRFGASVRGRPDVVAPEVIALPAAALFDQGGQAAVWIVDPRRSEVSLKRISIDHYETDRIVVAAGLTDGEIVVTAGVHQLRENQKVRIQEGNSR